jgi:phosphoglycerol transferase MdoB-like AlkP superfamily enzyme
MKWKPILVYVAVLLFVTAVAGVPFGFVFAFYATSRWRIPVWILILMQGIIFVLSALVLAHLAKRQTERTFAHALTVAFTAWAVSAPFNFVFLRPAPIQWATGIAFTMLTAVAGTLMGKALRGMKSC